MMNPGCVKPVHFLVPTECWTIMTKSTSLGMGTHCITIHRLTPLDCFRYSARFCWQRCVRTYNPHFNSRLYWFQSWIVRSMGFSVRDGYFAKHRVGKIVPDMQWATNSNTYLLTYMDMHIYGWERIPSSGVHQKSKIDDKLSGSVLVQHKLPLLPSETQHWGFVRVPKSLERSRMELGIFVRTFAACRFDLIRNCRQRFRPVPKDYPRRNAWRNNIILWY